MSGIVGIFYCGQRRVKNGTIDKMLDTIKHRGSDAVRVWSSDNVGFGHRMLWTTPESLHEILPFANQDNNLAITADARIDNRDELIPLLQINELPPDKITDSQIILAAYKKWGKDCPDKLLGDFAFAIWDGRKQELFCARDHFGVKPFYYYHDVNIGFIFASEIKALFSLPNIPRRLNEIRIADYLYPMMEDKVITSYENVFRLPPAHTLILSSNGKPKVEPYWSLDYTSQLKLNSDREYADAFLEIFTEAVRCRLRSAFPIGSHLSGGLDSSSVACVARNLLTQTSNKKLHTFSNVFDRVPECDEREYINLVLEQGSFIPHYIHADKFGPLSQWQSFFQYEDEAFIGPNHFLTWGLNRATKEVGVRVVLDGYDGDTTVSHGAFYFKELADLGDWDTFAVEAKLVSQHFDTSPEVLLRTYGFTRLKELAKNHQWVAFAQNVEGIGKHFKISRKNAWIQLGLKPIIPKYLLQAWRWLKNPQGFKKQPSSISSEFADLTAMKERYQSFNIPQNISATVREEQWRSFTSGLFTLNMELVDRCTSAFSIESRHPFMDKRLIEFCISLPPEQKLHQGWSRVVLRRAMKGILPPLVQWRGGKASMSANFQRGILELDKKIIDETIADAEAEIGNFINLEYLNFCHAKLMSQEKLNSEEQISIWRTLTLALWLKNIKTNLLVGLESSK